MKKNNFVYLLVSLVLITFVLGCSQDPIFSDIAKEIKLDDPTVRGNVLSMVQIGTNLYASNGNIATKPISQKTGWKDYTSPSGNVTKVASDENHLYALVTNQTDSDGDSYSYKVFAQVNASGNWTQITSSTSPITIFDNGASGAARFAYLRDSSGVKQLNGATLYASLTSITENGAGTSTVSAAFLTSGSQTFFADTLAFCSDGTNLFKANGSTLQYSVDGNAWTNGPSTEEPTSYAYYEENASTSYILVGTESGIQKVALSVNVPTSVSRFGSNADTAFGTYIALNVFAFPSEVGSCYVSIVKKTSSRYNGLWGYYSDRGNWNYE
mgnify:CR=1 FL=1